MKEDTIFGNFFAVDSITSTRLHNFAGDAISRFKADTEYTWTELLLLLQAAYDTLHTELGVADSTVNIRLGHTDTVDTVLLNFRTFVSGNEPFIARAVGGEGSPAYLEFYPSGLGEYSKVNKTTAPILLSRVAAAAAKYAVQLGSPLAEELQQFDADYNKARGAQQEAKGYIDETRIHRSDARKAQELALLHAVHQVGDAFPGDLAKCGSYFNFLLLHNTGHHTSGPAPVVG